MTPKEKAQELVDKYSKELEHIARIADEWSMSEFSEFRQIIAVKCASLAVDEIINELIGHEFSRNAIVFWTSVKQEIEKL
jgi:hypothetical protein